MAPHPPLRASSTPPPSSPWDAAPENSVRRLRHNMTTPSSGGEAGFLSLEEGLLDDYRRGGGTRTAGTAEELDEFYASDSDDDGGDDNGCVPRRAIRWWLQGASVVDLCVVAFLLLDGLSLPARNMDNPEAHFPDATVQRAQGVDLGLALVLGIKAVATLITVRKRPRQRLSASPSSWECSETCGCGCLAAYTALLVAVLLGISAPLAAYGQHQGSLLYRALVPEQWPPYALPLVLLAYAVGEYGQYNSLQLFRRRRRRRARRLLGLEETESPAPASSRPWWWSRSSLSASRTAAHNDVSFLTSDTTTDWADDAAWFAFLRRRRQHRRANGNDDDLRDDGSVDFASVQEEWATRASEDPHWWSRDASEGPGATAAANPASADDGVVGRDLSWADDNRQAPPPSASSS